MPTTLAIRFPLGRYHATRWDGGANTSDVEWPPSPWRILRALLATRYTRWADLDTATIERLLSTLGTPSAYLTPPTRAGSTRHYMPLIGHRTAVPGGTSQVIDAFLAVDPDQRLLVQWSTDLAPEDHATLRKLAEMVPYLGRSESICEMNLLEEGVSVDDRWWRLGVVGADTDRVQVLAPTTLSLSVLEQTTVEVRRSRRALPPGTTAVVYGRPRLETPSFAGAVPRTEERLVAMRFELSGPVHLRARSSVVAADAMHGLVSKILTNSGLDAVETAATMGLDTAGSVLPGPHEHLHILPLPTEPSRRTDRPLPANAATDSLLLWSPRGFRADVAGAIIDRARTLHVASHLEDELPARALLFAGAGALEEVYPTLLGPATAWISWLPYLPTRHRKKHQSDMAFIVDDVRREAIRHALPEPHVDVMSGSASAGQIAQFRRRRNGQSADRRRRGVYLRLTFPSPQKGAVVLGQLGHFGYGVFVPESTPTT